MKKLPLVASLALLVATSFWAEAASVKISDSYADKLLRDADTGLYDVVTTASSTFSVSVPIKVDISAFDENTTIDFRIGQNSVVSDGGGRLLADDPTYVAGKKSATFKLFEDPYDPNSTVVGRLTASWTATTLTLTSSSKTDLYDIYAVWSGQTQPINDSLDCDVVITVNGVETFVFSGKIYIKGQNTYQHKVLGDQEVDINSGSISGQADFVNPVLTILNPRANNRYTNNGPITVSGRVDDNAAVATVLYRWNDENVWTSIDAIPTTNKFLWSTDFRTLIPGTNTIFAYAADESTNVSPVVTRSFFYSVPAVLTLQTNGSGAIVGQKNGAVLEVGRGYKITAVPGKGQAFLYWSDGDGHLYGDSTGLTLNFIMTNGLVLRANFGPSPFPTVAGNYAGLFTGESTDSNPSGVSPNTSGYISLNITPKGVYSAKLMLAGATLPWTGQFLIDSANNQAYCRSLVKHTDQVISGNHYTSDMTAALTIDLATWSLLGGEIDVNYSSPFDSSNAVYTVQGNVARYTTNPPVGNFNFVLPASPDSSAAPGGYSYGTVMISKIGAVNVNLNLADGSPAVVFSTFVSADGSFPLYASTRKGQGVFLGWGNFPDGDALIATNVNWISPVDSTRGALYPGGFTWNDIQPVTGIRYVAPKAGTNLVDWTSGSLQFGGGNTDGGFPYDATFQNNKFTFPAGSKVTASLATGTGALTGSFPPFAGARAIPFKGILLPHHGDFSGAGYGFFKGTNETGYIHLSE